MSGNIEPSDMRASDAERATITDRLTLALNEGRLDLTEFDRRIAAAYAARTRADLVPLVADLPEPVVDPTAVAPVERRLAARKKMRHEFREWAGVSVILIAIWGVTSLAAQHVIFFWPMFPVGIWGAVLLAQLISGDNKSDDKPDNKSGRKPDDKPGSGLRRRPDAD